MAKLPELPNDYKSFLESHSNEQPYEFEGMEWWLATTTKLQEMVNIDGTEYLYIHQLEGYVKAAAEFFDSDSTTDEDENEYSFDRLRAGLAIGIGNGDVLYLDPSDGYSVWCFYHDGADVEKLAPNFNEWLADAELDEDY